VGLRLQERLVLADAPYAAVVAGELLTAAEVFQVEPAVADQGRGHGCVLRCRVTAWRTEWQAARATIRFQCSSIGGSLLVCGGNQPWSSHSIRSAALDCMSSRFFSA